MGCPLKRVAHDRPLLPPAFCFSKPNKGEQKMDYTTKIKELNDSFRKDFRGHRGNFVVTRGVVDLGQEAFADIMCLVQGLDNFTPDNDPHGEHDFGSFMYEAHRIFWKIDYYSDETCLWGSEAPHDPAKSYRVLTVMLAEEY